MAKFCMFCGSAMNGNTYCEKCGRNANGDYHTPPVTQYAQNFGMGSDEPTVDRNPIVGGAVQNGYVAREESKPEVVNVENTPLNRFLGPLASQFVQSDVNEEDVIYCFKLSSVNKRRNSSMENTAYPNGVAGVNNASDYVSARRSMSFYLVNAKGEVYILSQLVSSACYKQEVITKNVKVESGTVKVSVSFPYGDSESATFKLEADNLATEFYGDLKRFIRDFDGDSSILLDNLSSSYLKIKISKRSFENDKLYYFAPVSDISSFVSYNSDEIYMYNIKRKIRTDDIIAYHNGRSFVQLLTMDGQELTLWEFFKDDETYERKSELNLIFRDSVHVQTSFSLPTGKNAVEAKNVLCAASVNNLYIAEIDGVLYGLSGRKLRKCGLFKSGKNVYVKTDDGITEKYFGCEAIMDLIPALSASSTQIFDDLSIPQPFLKDGEIKNFYVRESSLEGEDCTYEYSKMGDYSFSCKQHGCEMTFIYVDKKILLSTAMPLGVKVSTMQERYYVKDKMKDCSLPVLYDFKYKRGLKSFLASTFLEIFKTDILLGDKLSIDHMIMLLQSAENETVSLAFKDTLGKIENADEAQVDLIKKLFFMYIQINKIHKHWEEWLTYYPHYEAAEQVKWLKGVYGSGVADEVLKNEYWECVSRYKKALQEMYTHISSYFSDMNRCFEGMGVALPDEIKRMNISALTRVSPISSEAILDVDNTEVANAVYSGAFVAGVQEELSFDNPMLLMVIRMVNDMYSQDIVVRKNIKQYGLQILEIWQLMMKAMQLRISELANEISLYHRYCLKRDAELFEEIAQDRKSQVKSTMENLIKEKIVSGTDEKFIEIIPQMNIRVSDIMTNIERCLDLGSLTLNEFAEHMFVFNGSKDTITRELVSLYPDTDLDYALKFEEIFNV